MPALTGFAPSITFAENTVNATPQLLDGDVVFTDAQGDFNGGTLTLTGLLAEDRVSVRNEGSGAGQIGLSGANVTFGGVVIGTLAGGSGATLTITFNASATSAAIDALIQNLTYANVSDTPTASRGLRLNITDAAGNDLGASGSPSFTQRTGTANPFNGVDVGYNSTPTFADLDGDGDLDAVVGERFGTLLYFRNTGTATAPVFVQQTGGNNPFNGVDVGGSSRPTFADLDGDGDLDAVVGEDVGNLNYFRNTGTASAPVFVLQAGGNNPFDGVDVGGLSGPTFADLDGDGDLDAVVGDNSGLLLYFRNTGTATAPVFVQQTGGNNPFNGVDVGYNTAPTFADLDGDGDLDAVVGHSVGSLNYFLNTGSAAAPVFVQQTGADNPFNGVDVGNNSASTFADLDGDGDLDALVGETDGPLNYFENTTPSGRTITVTVTAEADATSAADTLSGTAGADSIDGLGGDDILSGGAGNDTLNGNTGTDTASYASAAAGVTARLNLGTASNDGDGGSDTFVSIENLTGSAFTDLLVGNGGANVLSGGLGADTLLGLGGNDILIGGTGASNTLQGGLGDDTYVVDANDTVVEFSGQGTDSIQTSRTTYVLKDHFENLQYTGSSAFSGTGNGADNSLEGGSGNDVLIGRGGNDRLDGNSGVDTADYGTAAGGVTASLADGVASNDGDGGADTLSEIENLTGSAFADSLTGDALANVLSGGSGDDVLAGRGGNDTLRGGAGTDTADYSGAAAGVTIKLAINTATSDGDGGTDSFNSIENLTGSAFNDTLSGDGLANVISGGLGRDVLIGLGGNDTLIGGSGASNQLLGGLGDDTYVVTANDSIVEAANEGTDTVNAGVNNFVLSANIENLTFTGTGNFGGTGNASANILTGGDGRDTLRGGGGDDTLNGGAEFDTADFSGLASDYLIVNLGAGQFRITDSVGGRDGVDILNGIEQVRFSNGDRIVLSTIPETFPVLSEKDASPQVLPGLSDDDFLPLAKDSDLPLVLPGAEDPFADLFVGLDGISLARGADSPWQMLTLAADGAPDPAHDGVVGALDRSGWNHDTWSF